MKYKVLTSWMAAAGFLASALSVQGQFIYATGFEAPTYETGSVIGQDGWGSGFGSGGRSIVEGGGSHPAAPEGSQLLQLQKNAGAGSTGVRRAFTPDPITTAFSASFYMMVQFDSTGLNLHTPVTFQQTDSTANGARVGFIGDGSNVYAYVRSNTTTIHLDANPLMEGVQPIVSGVFYQFEVDVRPEDARFDVRLLDSGGSLLSSYSDAISSGNQIYQWIRMMNLNTASGQVTAYYDDLQIIPEPSTYALFLGGLALAGLVTFRRYRSGTRSGP